MSQHLDFYLPPLLESPSKVDASTYKVGCPIFHSNWVIPQILMQGAFPKDFNESFHDFSLLVNVSEHAYFGDYRNFVERNNGKVQYIHLPIADYSIAPDSVLIELVTKIVLIIESSFLEKKKNIKVYIHCVGGKGRSGTVSSLVFGLLYNRQFWKSKERELMKGEEVLEWIQKCFETRSTPSYPVRGYSPETNEQCEQVKRLMQYFNNELMGSQ